MSRITFLSVFFSRVFSLSWMLPLIFTALIFLWHYSPQYNTMLTLRYANYMPDASGVSSDYLKDMVTYHTQEPAFARRPLTTYLTLWSSRLFHVSVPYAWLGLMFVGFCLTGYLLMAQVPSGTGQFTDRCWTIALYYTSFSVLFAFAVPVFTYDEPLQYVFIWVAWMALQRKRWLLLTVTLLFAMIARETTLFFIPAFLYVLYQRKDLNSGVKAIAFSIGLYIAFLLVWFQVFNLTSATMADNAGRFSYMFYNFQNTNFAVESIRMLVLVLALPLALVIRQGTLIPKEVYIGFWVVLLINTPAVLLMAKAREARLFALPLLLLWPYAGAMLRAEWNQFKERFDSKPLIAWLFIGPALALALGLGYIFGWYYFPYSLGGPDDGPYPYYVLWTCIVLVMIGVSSWLNFLTIKEN